MSVNGTNPHEDAEMDECDNEKVVTMMDVLQEQTEFEEDANAVLGASDDKNCTYSKGHLKRQAIYACMTCCPDAKTDPTKRAGVCLACSLTCHESHDLIELYTKRNFKCDCGNPLFNSHPCQFTPVKTDLNEENSYNQNFSGLYCICHRPYPDPEAKVEEEMIQCIICEDWLHATHLDAVVPNNDQYSEMICKACMERNEFLHDYSNLAVNVEDIDVDVLNSTEINETSVCSGVLNAGESTSVNEDIESNKNNDEEGDRVEKTIDEQNTNTSEDKAVNVDTEDSVKSSDKCDSVNMEENDNKPETSEQALDESTNVTSGDLSDSKNEEHHSKSNVPDDSEMEANDCPENKTENKDIANEESTLIENSDNVVIAEQKTEDVNKSEENEMPKETGMTEKIVNKEQMEEDLLLADPVGQQETSNDGETVQKNSTNNELKTDNPTDPSKDMDTSESENTNPTSTENSDKEKSFTDTESVPTSSDPKEEAESKKESDALDSESIEQKVELPTETDNKVTEETKPMEITESVVDMKPEDEDNEVVTVKASISKNEDENNATKGDSELSDETNKDPDSQKRKYSIETDHEDSSIKKPKLEETKSCVRPRDIKKVYQGATFWPSNFRHKLCTCNECISMYKDLSVLFLIDPEDTVSAYETIGKEKCEGKAASQYEKGLDALSSLDRTQQINALTEYNKMRDKLLEFLKSFKDRREIVKEEDIKAFFAGMKPKREPDGVYFCR